jgi:hypothetical protein
MLKHNMRVIEYQNASEFLAVAHEHLLENEAVNAIILNYAHNQMQGIKSAITTTFYCVAEGDKPLPQQCSRKAYARYLARLIASTTTGNPHQPDVSTLFKSKI